jgi:4-hydroxybenzoyl-CoA reductase subunit alpha
VLDLPTDRIRVVQPALGGAFGGKSEPFDLEFVRRQARDEDRPPREDPLHPRGGLLHAPRPAPDADAHAPGADADGKLTGLDSKILIDGGAYSSFGLVTSYYSGQLLTAPTGFATYRFDASRAYTNKPPCGPKRGHGSVQPRFAFEIQLDKMAEKLGLDPIELRRRNDVGPDTTTINGQRITQRLPGVPAPVEAESGWRERRGKLGFGRGPRRGRLQLHLGHGLSGLPQRHAPGRRCRSAWTAAAAPT